MKVEKLARIYDAEIGPVWGSKFGKLLLRDLEVPQKGQVLDISCGTGYPTTEILRRMSEGSRLIAIDASSAMLDVARRKIAELGPLGKKGVFFRTESAVPKLSFADDVYDLVVCNLGLGDMPSLEVALRDFSRVCKVDGQVRCSLPLAGTFQEFHDLYREVLIKHDKHEALERLERHIARFPTMDHVERCMKTANLDGRIEHEEFQLLFKSSREFFFAPVIEYGPLQEWKDIAGPGQEMQDVFWYIKEAIDAYYDGRPYSVTVKAGCIVGTKHAPRAQAPDHLAYEIGIVDGIGELETDLPTEDEDMPRRPQEMAAGSVNVVDADELGVMEDLDHDIEDIVEEDEDDGSIEIDIDAFVDGARRPSHLDDRD
jgi:ubiquinone/menaquinone biosynthesis C-methylase UbiE